MASSFSNSYGSYNPTNFTNQFVQRATTPQPTQSYQTPYQTWSPQIQAAWRGTSGSTLRAQAPTSSGGGGGGGGGSSSGGGGGGGGGSPMYYSADRGWIDQSAYDQIRGQIESGYNAYFSQLDDMMNTGLPAQKTAQEGVVQNQYKSGLESLTGQKTESLSDLNTQRRKTTDNQVKNLRDIAENLRNLMYAGSVKLGAVGAGDSSAANMYSYAYSKLGNKARGEQMTNTSNIMSDIGDREFKVNNTFNTESNRLASDRDAKINSISQWFAEQQNAIRQMKAQGQISKAQDLAAISQQALNMAMQQYNMVQQQYASQKSALESWALSRSQDINQLKTNMAGISNYIAPLTGFGGITSNMNMGSSSSGYNYYPGSNQSTEEKKLFY